MATKPQLHPRNRHNQGYDFIALSKALPALKAFVKKNDYGNLSIDFANADAVKALNSALLKQYYQIDFWDIPKGYLCPPIPGRVDYIHYLNDLLVATNKQMFSAGNNVNVLDIGTGASCIYPLLGQRQYQWHFTATDIDPISIKVAENIVKANPKLKNSITCELQTQAEHIFKGIIKADKHYALTMCNPPFHSSIEQATKGSERKWQNLNKNKSLKQPQGSANLNFGGQKAELWCPGGELNFIEKMITESRDFSQQVLWFTCLVSKKDNIGPLKQALKKAQVKQLKVVNMAQGQKVSRFIAWSFLTPEQQQHWCQQQT